jgi:endonuclease YncB( thermonuclease family)
MVAPSIGYVRWLLVLLAFTSLCEGAELQRFQNCTLIPTDWADGDSFQVRFPNGDPHTVRLYGVDCLELHVSRKSDQTRLRSQRRYFGISDFGGNANTSALKAIELAKAAKERTQSALRERFTVDTAFADAGGDGRHERIYAFVITNKNEDLGELLVWHGLARSVGVNRGRFSDLTRDEYVGRLNDLELIAAKKEVGIWKFTDWRKLPKERYQERRDEAELEAANIPAPKILSQKVNLNSASRDELMTLPGIGEVLATRIIEGRESEPYKKPDDLRRVSGFGKKKIEKLLPYLSF